METVLICTKSWGELSDAIPSLTAMGIIGSNILFFNIKEHSHGYQKVLKKIILLPYFYDVVSSGKSTKGLCSITIRIRHNTMLITRGKRG